MSESEPKSPRTDKEKSKKQTSATVAVVNTPNDETPAYSGLQHSFGRNADTGTDKVHRRSLIQHNQEENDTKPQDNKEFEFVSPRTNAKAGPRYDAIAVLVVMSFKVLVAPIILVAICLNSPYLQSPYVFRAASESYLGYEKLNPDVTYDCPDCGVTCKRSVLQLAQFKQDPMMGKPAYGSLRTNTFEDYNETLSAAALALIDELESANAVCGDGTSDWDDSLTFISAEPQLIVKAVSVLKLPVSNDMIAEVTAAVTSACNSRWTIEARLKTFITEGVCVHNYYNSQWEWASTKDGVNIVMSHNTIRSRYADKVEMSILPGIVIMQILLMSMLSMYQVMSQKQSVLLSQIWAYRCQNGRMQAMYLLQIAYHLYRESDTYYLALGTGTMSVECVWNLTFCVMAFSYSFVNIVKSRTGEQQLDRHFRLSWEMVLLIVTAIVANMLISIRYTSLSYIFEINSKTLLRSTPVGAEVCKLTDSCVVFSVNIAVVIAAFAMLVWGATASVAYVLRTRHNPHPVKDLMSWFISWKVAFQVTLRPPPKTKAKALSHGASIVNLADATSFECYCIGEHFRFMFNDCEDISHVKKNNLRVPTAEAVLLSGFVYRGKYLYRADDIILLLFTRFAPNFILRTFNVLIVRWDVNPATYAVSRPTASAVRHPAPDGAMAFATGTASRPSSLLSSRGGSRGSTSTEIESRSSFLIAAVAENRAREIGIPVEILVVETSKSRKINEEISKRFAGSSCRVVPLARKYFNQTKGAEDIKRVMANNVDINIGRNYVAMASVACVMKYIEYIQGVYIAEKSMKFSRIQRSSQARQEVVGVFLDNPRGFSMLWKSCVISLTWIGYCLRDEQFRGIKADIERVVNDRVKVCRSAAQKRIQECLLSERVSMACLTSHDEPT
ncbi:hypothetical protein GQ600_1146 [Phytophthora cactorum]|nr:hypothetical protein GQ600_1146 [Phytophthora cactorum]